VAKRAAKSAKTRAKTTPRAERDGVRTSAVGKGLVVVESPTKVKTIQKYLAGKYLVKASMGHVRDLPKSQLGVDEKKNFRPNYVVSPTKKKILDELKKAAEKADALYVATDPDREGEAIGWHLAQELPVDRKKIFRITFNEITERAVKAAFERPGKIDLKKVDAQQARRVLDRLVGYKLSPLLWDKVQRGLSAGRVQSVAVRLIVDREREIEAFVPQEYWSLHATLEGRQPPQFVASLREVNGERVEVPRDGRTASLPDEATTRAIMAGLEGTRWVVKSVTRGERRRNPAPPFITSTLQQEASRKLGFWARKTMQIAQQLYEGVDIGDEGAVGLITYMRTDSVQVSQEAQQAARTLVSDRYGAAYLPAEPPVYKSRGRAQEAHEAIRPSDVTRDPRSVARFLTKEQLGLYRIIWERFVASQMQPAVFDTVAADIEAGATVFRAQGQTVKFKGFTAVYVEGREDEDGTPDDDAESAIPPLSEGDVLGLLGLDPKQHFTQPPPRYTEASLVKALEELGIGRPSTYASILGTIIHDRGYVRRERRTLFPSELGLEVTDLLMPFFKDIMNVEFTAQMEDELDRVEEGDVDWAQAVRDFYGPFEKDLAKAQKEMRNVKAGAETGEACPECGQPLLERRGRFGKFFACSSYPDCKYTRDAGKNQRAEDEPTNESCPTCSKPMVIKHGRFGKFIACSGYPDCKTTKPVTLGIACPEPNCSGQLVERRSKRGRTFYGCSAYPECKFVVWQRPVAEPCPQCQATFLTERIARGGNPVRMCVREGCGFRQEVETTVA
jgi:DNA topoisomerase-1